MTNCIAWLGPTSGGSARGAYPQQPTALVHEAYIRMVDQKSPMDSRGHFLAVAKIRRCGAFCPITRAEHHAERRGRGRGRK